MTSPVSPSLPALRQLLNEAQDEVVRLCEPGSRWRMTVPVDEARDSDTLLMGALTAASELIERQAAAIEAVQAVVAELDNRPVSLQFVHAHVIREALSLLPGITPTTEEKSTDER